MSEYRERAVDRLLHRLFGELPALLLVGPRASGKTTTASRHAATIVHLDNPAEAAAFQADPDSALRAYQEPILLDEWQSVPGVLGAVKRSVDLDSRPGRFLLTGSVRADLDASTWPGTGRVVRLTMYGLTVAERSRAPEVTPFLDRVDRGEVLVGASTPVDLRGYVEHALISGFPEAALSSSEDTRRRWIESYVDQLLTRDASQVTGTRDPAKLRRFFEAYALNSAGIVEDKRLYEAAGINRKTALAYEQLLVNLMVAERVQPWSVNRQKRFVRAPKRYLVDPALLAGALLADTRTIISDGDLLGRILDTFVTAQIRSELSVATSRPRLFHLRQQQGRYEIDLLCELSGRRVAAIEIKAKSAPDDNDARHLKWLRNEIGDRFVAGVVLHTGPGAYPIDDRIVAAPISTLWATS